MESQTARDLRDEVVDALDNGNFQHAENILDARKSEFNSNQTFSFKYRISAEKSDVEGAVAVIEEACRSGWPFLPSIRSLSWLCDGLVARRRYQLGLALCDALVIKGGGLALFEQRIRFLSLTRDFLAALELLRDNWSEIPPSRQLEFGILEARLLLLLGREEPALRLFKCYLQRPKGTRSMYGRAARLAIKLKKHGDAQNFTSSSIHLFGGTTQHYLLLATIVMRKGNYNRVIGHVNSAFNLLNNTDNPDQLIMRRCYTLVSEARLALKQYNLALNALLEYAEKDSEWIQGKIFIIEFCLALKLHDDGEKLLSELMVDAPTNPEVLAINDKFHQQFGDQVLVHETRDVAESKSNQYVMEKARGIEIPDEFMPQWTGYDLSAGGSIWKGMHGHTRSVGALLMRESRTRFVRHKLGALWLFLEPVAQTALMVLIFTLASRSNLYGMSIPLFIVTGLVPYQLFSSSFGKMLSAVSGNKDLFMHPRVQVLDIIVSRAVLETMSILTVFVCLLLVLAYFGEALYIGNISVVFVGFMGLLSCGIGLGLLTAGVKIVFPGIATIITHFVRILFFTSGVFFSPEMFPAEYRDVMMLNPLLQYISLIRNNFTPILGYENVDFMYAFVWALGMLTVGFIFERVFRFKLLSS